MRRLTIAGLLAARVFVAAGASAQSSPRITTRPDADGVRTKVSIGLFMVDISAIRELEQVFTCDIVATVSWRDPRLALPADAADRTVRVLPLSEIWHPGLTLLNRRAVQILAMDSAHVDAEGQVRWRARRFAEIASPLALHDFPFDTQELRIDLASTLYGPDELELSVDEVATGRLDTLSIAGWDVELGDADIGEVQLEGKRVRSRFVQRMTARRQSTFFVMKVILPLSLIVFMAWTVFWINPENLGPQIGISTASVLTLIAFQFSLVNILPRVSYLTRIDTFLFGATVLVFVALGEAVLAGRLARKDPERAQTIDRYTRWSYATLFVVHLVVSLT